MIHTAITIGPIFKTLQKARSAKAIWSASYLFSFLMDLIYQEVEKEVGKDQILLPYYEPVKQLQVGILPDRILFESELKDFEDMRQTVIEKIASNISNDLNKNTNEITAYLNNYLTIKQVKKDFAEGEEVVKTLNKLLDTAELFTVTNPSANEDYLSDFFEMKDDGYNFLIKHEFKSQPFKSIEEIVEGSNKDNYIALIQADGDNFGQFISSIKDRSSIQKVSACLFNFSKKAVKEIRTTMGVPIYAGGDDLLFFIPVSFENKTLLNVIDKIDEVFREEVVENKFIQKEVENLNAPLSLSFGVNIFYKKFPLDQALTEAGELLFQKAKSGEKNAIALRVTKHSGQVIELTLHKNQVEVIKSIKGLFSKQNLDSDFISGFMYKLSGLKPVIKGIALSNNVQNRWNAFFENYFDEDAHSQSLENGFLLDMKQMISLIYQKYPLVGSEKEIEKQNEDNINLLYAMLRFHHFINS